MAPAQTWEPRVVTIRGDPFSSRFHRQRCKIGIADQIPFGSHRLAQSSEDFPVALARRNYNASGLLVQGIHILQSLVEPSRLAKDTSVGEDANNAAERLFRYPEHRFRQDGFLKPLAKLRMIGRILTFRVHQDVNVD